MSNLARAQAVVEGCMHTHKCEALCKHDGGFLRYADGACAPCLAVYAEQVRREERERCATTAEEACIHPDPKPETGCNCISHAIADALRAEAGET